MTKFSCPFPENLNPLSPNGYQLVIDTLPGVVFFSQTVNIPGITMPESIQYTPLSDVGVPAEKINFENLVVQFLVDENMSNYKNIFRWMQGLTFPDNNNQWVQYLAGETFEQNQPNESELAKMYSDARLIILGNNNNSIQTLKFSDIYPIALSPLQFTNISTDVEYLQATVEFKYTTYDFEEQD